MEGQGKAVVCAVGNNTLLTRLREGESLYMPETSTHLEEKLKITAKQIEKFAILMMIISIITHIIYLIVYIPSND